MRLFQRIFLVLLLIGFKAVAQTTPNIGFENGNFDNWECFTGTISPVGAITVANTGPVANRQTIIGSEGANILDPYGKFPILCPNGSKYCMRLGNDDTHAEAERITYTFNAPASGTYSIVFNYAVVLENPSDHENYQQPAFQVKVYDVTDNYYIDCPQFDFVAGYSSPGFNISTVSAAKDASIYYKDWTTATIDLKNYHNKTIRLEFTTNDCTKGGHFGYAYIDVNDNTAASPITGNSYCLGQKYITLNGPTGFANYFWYTGDLSKQLWHGQAFRLTPPPADMTPYALIVQPYDGLGCVDTLYTVVNKINEGFNLNVQDTVKGCPGTGVDLTAASVTAGSSAGMTLSYFVDSLGTNFLYNPNKVDSSGTYYIHGINKEGCQNTLPVVVALGLPAIQIIEPPAVDFPTTVDLTKAYVSQPGLTYTFYTDAETNDPVKNYTAIKYSGKFYIKATNQYGCTDIVPVNVTINPPPPYSIVASTAFTPNNDGINDHFALTLVGYVVFNDLKIFNRYGQLVFTGKSLSQYWDGKFDGKELPAGTYYWIFEGEDTYNNVKATKSGSITIIR